jgi:hypothetical protein
MKKVYFTKEFPVSLFKNQYAFGKEGWVDDPSSVRHLFQFLQGIAENVLILDRCDPIKIEWIDNGYRVGKGGAGSNRLQAITQVLKWTTFPALVTSDHKPTEFPSELIDNENKLNSYYRIGSARFDPDGDFTYIPWSWDADTIKNTFLATPETTNRMYRLFKTEDYKHQNDYDNFNKMIEEQLLHHKNGTVFGKRTIEIFTKYFEERGIDVYNIT